MSDHAIEDLKDKTFRDKLHILNYVVFLQIGIGLLWPWNSILSGTEYFKNEVFSEVTLWAKVFASTMMTVSTVSSMLFNIWLAERQHSYSERVIRGLVWEIIAFVILSIVCVIHGLFPHFLTFTIIMLLVLISSVATAMTQNGIMAIANVFGSEYGQSVMMGQAIAGILPAIVLFLVSFTGTTSNHNIFGIVGYFMTTVAVSSICIWLYLKSGIEHTINKAQTTLLSHSRASYVPFTLLFSKLKYLVLAIFSTFFLTLAFPVFASTVSAVGLPFTDANFIPLVFTIWNVGDLYGRTIAEWPIFRSRKFSPRKVFAYSVLRIFLLPLFLIFVAKSSRAPYGSRAVAVLNDLAYMMLQFIFGVTNGHAISMSIMKVPEQLSNDDEKEAAGGFTNIFISSGLTLGSVFSYLVVLAVDKISKNVEAS